MKHSLLMLILLLPFIANTEMRVVLEAIVYEGTIPADGKPANMQNYDAKTPVYTQSGKQVVVGYNDRAEAQAVMDIVFSREELLNKNSGIVTTKDGKMLHIKIIADAATNNSTTSDSKPIGEAFDLVNAKTKVSCTLFAAKKDGLDSKITSDLLEMILIAISGSGL